MTKTMAEMVWKTLSNEIKDIKAQLNTLQARTERSETTSGHPSYDVATAPLAASGAKQGDEIYITDGENLADRTTDNGAMAFYDPSSDSWISASGLPRRWSGWPDEAIIIAGGAWGQVLDSLTMYDIRFQQLVPADGDAFTLSFPLKPGSYTLYALGLKGNNFGMIDWYIDDVLQIAGQDWYDVATIRNVVLSGAITVTGHGLHVLKGVVNGRNGASVNFFISLTKLWIKPSAD